MSIVDKKALLFDRDEEGELLSKEVELIIDEKDLDQQVLKGQTIVLIPLMRGEIKKILTAVPKEGEEIDTDAQLVSKYCINPSYTDKELAHMKGWAISALVDTILFHSGVKINKKKNTKENIEKAEDDFAKN